MGHTYSPSTHRRVKNLLNELMSSKCTAAISTISINTKIYTVKTFSELKPMNNRITKLQSVSLHMNVTSNNSVNAYRQRVYDLPAYYFDEISILIFELDGADITNSENIAPMCLYVIFYIAQIRKTNGQPNYDNYLLKMKMLPNLLLIFKKYLVILVVL